MSESERYATFELRYRLGAPADAWARTLAALVAWDRALAPATFERLSDGAEPEPWSESRWEELARLCEAGPLASRMLYGADSRWSLRVKRAHAEVELSIIRPLAGDPADELRALLVALAGALHPALGMAGDPDDPDAEWMLQGLRKLSDLPPLLYLDREAAAEAGGVDHLSGAPCPTARTGDGGILFWVERAPENEVARFLGLPRTWS